MSQSPDALAEVVARVTWLADRLYGLPGEKQLLKLTPQGAERYACDLRTLLAALAEAQADKERLDWFDRIWKDDDINALDLAWQSSTPGPAGSGRAAIDAAIAATKQGTR